MSRERTTRLFSTIQGTSPLSADLELSCLRMEFFLKKNLLMSHQSLLMFGELRLINPRIFLLAALLLTALNPLSAQISVSGDVNPPPHSHPFRHGMREGFWALVLT
jgi:hypothetical protein